MQSQFFNFNKINVCTYNPGYVPVIANDDPEETPPNNKETRSEEEE